MNMFGQCINCSLRGASCYPAPQRCLFVDGQMRIHRLRVAVKLKVRLRFVKTDIMYLRILACEVADGYAGDGYVSTCI